MAGHHDRLLSIKDKHLKRLILTGVETAQLVLEMLATEKLLTNFGVKILKFVNPVTGRLHCRYNLAGAKSGRFSASNPNLQQLPKARAPQFRACIIPAPGNVLVVCDYSQIELRGCAFVSGDPAMTAVLGDSTRDMHRETAAAITGLRVTDITDDQRSGAKAVNFGAAYGIGPRTLAENAFAEYDILMTEDEARAKLNRFFETYPTFAKWRKEHANRCQLQGYIPIGCGRIVKAAWEKESGGYLTFNQCIAVAIQGICADCTLRALELVHRRLHGLDAGLVLCVHDELVVEARKDHAERVSAILEESMIEAFVATIPGAPFHGVAKAAIGANWLTAKPK